VRCKKDFSQNLRVCPFCGMPNVKPPTKDKAVCPKCKIRLEVKKFRQAELAACPECSGVWLDTLDFEHLTSEKDVYADPEVSTYFIPEPPENSGGLYECVRCNDRMNRFNFKIISGILIDICGQHGAWLDDGELTRLRTFIASGGLDKSQDQEIRKNKRDLRNLASRVNNIDMLLNVLNWRSIRQIFLPWP